MVFSEAKGASLENKSSEVLLLLMELSLGKNETTLLSVLMLGKKSTLTMCICGAKCCYRHRGLWLLA